MKLFLSSTTLAVLPFQGKPRGEQQQSAYHSIAIIGLAKKSARATPLPKPARVLFHPITHHLLTPILENSNYPIVALVFILLCKLLS